MMLEYAPTLAYLAIGYFIGGRHYRKALQNLPLHKKYDATTPRQRAALFAFIIVTALWPVFVIFHLGASDYGDGGDDE